VGHKPTDKVYVATEPVQLGDGHVALELLRSGEGGLKLRAAVESISSLARLNFQELLGDLKALGFGKARKSVALSFNPKTRAPKYDLAVIDRMIISKVAAREGAIISLRLVDNRNMRSLCRRAGISQPAMNGTTACTYF
jgi:hypothetical protein